MAKHNAANEVAKRDYLQWLRNTRGRSEDTLDAIAAAIDRFETFNRHRDFKTFRREQAVSFKQHLALARHPKTARPLAIGTIVTTLNAVRAFFDWLAREPGYRSKITASDVDYFRPTDHEARVASARRDRPSPSLKQVQHVLASMPHETLVERRDRAVVALILLTGARDSAVASLSIKRLDLEGQRLIQDARDVNTKFRKTFTTWFFPVGDEAGAIVAEWVSELKDQLLYGPDDPLFPVTAVGLDDVGAFARAGLERRFWTTASPIRAIFRRAFEQAGLPTFGPHSIRSTLVRLGYDLKLGPREAKAWSQNLGHESVLTTFGSYGTLNPHEQAEVMRGLALGGGAAGDGADLRHLLSRLTAHLDGMGARSA